MAEESLLLAGIQSLQEMGFFEFFLPFILFFVIIFGALQKTKVFGEDRKDIDAVIALVIALIASTTSWVLKGVAGFLPWVGFIALIVVAFMMLAAMVYGGDVSKLFESPMVKAGALIFVIVALGIGLFYGLGFSERYTGTGISLSETDIALGIMGILGIVIFAVVVKGGGSKSSGGGGG